MYVYHYRCFDRYDRSVVSLAVLTDASARWRPAGYRYGLWGCTMELTFPVVKLRDYRTQWTVLEASPNPFATVVMAHLHSQTTRRHPERRLQEKLRLVRHLYARGYTRQEVLDLFCFLDWILTLPPALETRFQTAVFHLEEERQMRYITSIERMGIEKGREEGLQQGEVLLLRRQFTRRFGVLPAWVEQRLLDAVPAELERWADRILEAQQLDDSFRE
jgi:hypothetical protein